MDIAVGLGSRAPVPLALDSTRLLAKFVFYSSQESSSLKPSFFPVKGEGGSSALPLSSSSTNSGYRKLIPFKTLLPVDYVGNLCPHGDDWLAWNRKSVSSFAW